MEIEKTQVTLNTVNRKFNSTISRPIFTIDPLYNIVAYKVKNLSIPLTVFNIDSRNNKFLIEFASVEYTLTVPPGNYTSTTLFNVFDTFLATVFGGAASPSTYGLSYSTTTYLWNIVSNSGNFIVKPIDNNIYYELGISSSQLSVATANLLSSFPSDLAGVKVVSLCCPSFDTKQKNENYNIIASCNITEQNGDVANYFDQSNDYLSCNVNSLSNLQFFFIDERERILDVKNDWVVSIIFETV